MLQHLDWNATKDTTNQLNMADQNTDTAQVDENQMSTLEITITAILIVFILYMLKKLLFSS